MWRVLHEEYRTWRPLPTWGPDPMRRTALLSQVLAVNTLLVVATVFAATVAARLDLGEPAGTRQFLVLVAGDPLHPARQQPRHAPALRPARVADADDGVRRPHDPGHARAAVRRRVGRHLAPARVLQPHARAPGDRARRQRDRRAARAGGRARARRTRSSRRGQPGARRGLAAARRDRRARAARSSPRSSPRPSASPARRCRSCSASPASCARRRSTTTACCPRCARRCGCSASAGASRRSSPPTARG